jgi:ribonuclease E
MPAAVDPEGGPVGTPEPVRVPIIEARHDPPADITHTPHELLSAAVPPAPEPDITAPTARLDQEPVISEPPRRRSTVREPAPVASRGEAHQPAPELAPPPSATEPVVTSPAESESSDRPRRSGWWSKRVLGRG